MRQKRNQKAKINLIAGIDKFRSYATPRNFLIKESSYGIYCVSHKGRPYTEIEAVRAARTEKDGTYVKGWILNLRGRRRSFVPDGSGWEVVKRK